MKNKTTSNFVCYLQAFNFRQEKDDLYILHDLVKEQWKLGKFENSQEKTLSPEDRRAQKILETSMTRVGKRFETGLVWKRDDIVLPDSKTNALRRLYSTERIVGKIKSLAEMNSNKFKEMEAKQYIRYIRKLSQNEANETSGKAWYKPSKLRIVYDASAKTNRTRLKRLFTHQLRSI